MHFLITGHTGFKGSWLSLLLKERGHVVSGLALKAEPSSLFESANISNLLETDYLCDIRDYPKMESYFKRVNPDVVIHLAAQALVRQSYKDPVDTFETNAMGTINVLKASQKVENLKAQLIITTDKVYKNVNKSTGYIESDSLGGHDPYSASKAMADIATQSWLASFTNAPTAIVRAGNVIGGGDISADRLIPDLINAFKLGVQPQLRYPNAVRPWQHVLDCLNGYLLLANSLLQGSGEGIWNFGPDKSQIRTVAEVVSIASSFLGVSNNWEKDSNENPQEAGLLLLNSDKARTQLNWSERLGFEESINWTMNWYKNVDAGGHAFEATLNDIKKFENL